jgi:hypothetical protein
MDWQKQLIALYVFICKQYESNLHVYCQRFTHYAALDFTDEEVITIYLFGVLQGREQLKEIYLYVTHHLPDWFPRLPSYTAFVQRLNRVAGVFVPLIEALLADYPNRVSADSNAILMDSMPIVLAQRGRRFKAKVAPEIATNNGYCATKKLYYYGVKLHVLARYQKGQLPMPTYIGLTSAGMHDNKAFEHIATVLENEEVFADKAYNDCFVEGRKHFHLLTPVKKAKNQEFLEAADQWLSTAVSRVRQPIESFFNWIEEKTGIQLASKVRSYNGLIVHVFGKIAAALCIKCAISIFSS